MHKNTLLTISKFQSIKTVLLVWFLLLSLVPLLIVSYTSYKSSVGTVHKIVESELKYTVPLSSNYINSWFSNRENDISNWSTSHDTIRFIKALSKAFVDSKKPLQSFTTGYDYIQLIDKYRSEYIKLSQTYAYIYDIFLIDTNGNILYSLNKESDFATNLNDGPYASTRFASSYRHILENEEISFSDFDRYEPSGYGTYGFISAPIHDHRGSLLGVFSVQIKPDPIFNNLKIHNSVRKGMSQYIVGTDGIIRSEIAMAKEVLTRKIHTEQFALYKSQIDLPSHDEISFSYTGPDGKKVYGIHHQLDILGVKWALITEIDEEVILSSTQKLTEDLILIMTMTTILIVLISWLVSRRITKPIEELSSASTAIASGHDRTAVKVHNKDEIGQLATSYNHMLDVIAQNESALKEQKHALDVHNIVAITDLNGTITYVNKKFIDISGYTREELIGQNHRLLSSKNHDTAFWKKMFDVITKGEPWQGEICDKTKDGRLIWMDTTILPFLDDNGKPRSYIAMRTDITDRIEKDKKLMQQSRLAQMGELISMIAHQWRQPLAAISAVTSEFKIARSLDKFEFASEEEAEKFNTFFDKKLDSIDRYIHTLSTTIDDFRNFYKPNKVSEISTIHKPIEQALKIIETTMLNKKTQIYKEYNSSLQLKIYSSEMMQVILNILKNAQDNFSEKETIDATLSIMTRDEDDTIVLEICDNGGGIPEEIIDKIFDPYFSTKEEKNGTGLGLYMSKIIVEDHHHGTLDVYNNDKGVCFTVRLPWNSSET